jgi:hypothetical protein
MKFERMTKSDLRSAAPAIFATEPVSSATDKYMFVPTYKIIDTMTSIGWYPVQASQSYDKKYDKDGVLVERHLSDYGRHMVKFSNPDLNFLKGMDLQFVIINAHNTKVAFRGYVGIDIFVCSNGLIRGQIESAVRAVHIKKYQEALVKQIGYVLDRSKDIKNEIESYNSIELTEVEKDVFAMEAFKLRFSENSRVEPNSLLIPRRDEDSTNTLWDVFNRCQEAIIKGGVEFKMYNGSKYYTDVTKPVNQIDRQTTINIGLWNLMQKYVMQKRR